MKNGATSSIWDSGLTQSAGSVTVQDQPSGTVVATTNVSTGMAAQSAPDHPLGATPPHGDLL